MDMPPQIKIIIQNKADPVAKLTRVNVEKDMTYEDLLEIVGIQEKIPIAEYCFYKKVKTDYIRIKMKDTVQPSEVTGTIHLKSVPLIVTISHLGVEKNIKVDPSDTPTELRKKFTAETNEMMGSDVKLSFNGRVIDEFNSLEEDGIMDAYVDRINSGASSSNGSDPSPLKIDGAMNIEIEDDNLLLNTSLEVFPFETVRDVMKRFCKEEKRQFIEESSLSIEGKSIDIYSKLSESLHPITNGSKLYYRSAPYNVEIKDDSLENEYDSNNKEASMLQVEDGWTVGKVREIYGRRPDTKLLSEKDRFFFKETALDEDVMLYRLNLGEGEVLHLRRAHVEEVNFYTCADCGADLSLKPRDAVRCKYCFFRIVYKKRTPKICQYNCS